MDHGWRRYAGHGLARRGTERYGKDQVKARLGAAGLGEVRYGMARGATSNPHKFLVNISTKS